MMLIIEITEIMRSYLLLIVINLDISETELVV